MKMTLTTYDIANALRGDEKQSILFRCDHGHSFPVGRDLHPDFRLS
jgi:hypothetical protein